MGLCYEQFLYFEQVDYSLFDSLTGPKSPERPASQYLTLASK